MQTRPSIPQQGRHNINHPLFHSLLKIFNIGIPHPISLHEAYFHKGFPTSIPHMCAFKQRVYSRARVCVCHRRGDSGVTGGGSVKQGGKARGRP